MSWGADKLGVTEETFGQIKKAVTTGITSNTGLFGYNLSRYVSLVPAETPFRNRVPRVSAPEGAPFAVWRTLVNINNEQTDGAVPDDYAGTETLFQELNVSGNFQLVAKSGLVTEDAVAQAQGYADALAVTTVETMKQEFITENINLLWAQSFAAPSLAAPSLATAASGGSISSGSAIYVTVAGRTGKNYYYGGSGPAASSAHTSVGTTSSANSVTATVTAVRTIVAYDWFVGSSGSNMVYYTTTTVNTVTITTIPTAAQAVPTTLPLISSVQPTTPPTADTSYQTYWMNGLQATILGDWGGSGYVTPGGGTAQGAYWSSLGGSQFTVEGAGVLELDEMNLAMYNAYPGITPTRYIVSTQVINDLAKAALSNPQAITWLVPNDAEGRANVVMSGAVAKYLNKTKNGYPIMIEVDPYMVPGVLIAEVDVVPWMGSNIDSTLRVETLRDYQRYDYGINRQGGVSGGGPRYEFDIRCFEAFENAGGPVMGVLQDIGAGIGL